MQQLNVRRVLLVLVTISTSLTIAAQCGENTTSGNACTRSFTYAGEYLPDEGCGVYTTINDYNLGQYFRMPVLEGACYTINTCGAPVDTQIAAFQGNQTTGPFAYNDDNGPSCTGTAASMTITPSFTDYIRVDVRQYFCATTGTTPITVRLRQNNNLSFTSSSEPMCEGETRVLTATPVRTDTPPYAGAGDRGTFSGPGVSGITFTAPTPTGASEVYTIVYSFGYCTRSQNITVYRNPSTANAGNDQNIACDATTTTLEATTPTYGTGTWSLVNGTGTILEPNNPTTEVTGLTSGIASTFRWTVTNGPCGSSTDDVTITPSIDNTPPTPDTTTLAFVNAQCQVTALNPPTASDNCSETVTVTNNATLPITTQGTTIITWAYDDGNGNVTFQNQSVIIDDTTPPTPDTATLADVIASCEVSSLTPPTASDNCSETVTVTNNATLPITTQGTTIITWAYDDGNGNVTFQNQNVIIDDTTPPTPDTATLADVIASCEVSSLIPPTASDNCSETVTVTNNATLPITTQGTTIITWAYDDGNGNVTFQNQNVIIDDTTPPTPDTATLADVIASCEVSSLTPPTASDNCSETVTVTNNATLPITTQGTTIITWAYDDGNGNVTFQNQNVIIDDTTPPTPDNATLADVIASCEVSSLTPPTASDNCSETVTVTNNATLPITTQGTTIITWAYDDGNGNVTFQNQNVIIDDTTPPTPDTATLADVIASCEVSSLIPPTASDNCSETVTVTNNATLPITTQGTTIITWAYDDGNGNVTFQNQNVIIDDTDAPVITCPEDTTVEPEGANSYTLLDYSSLVTDNCSAPTDMVITQEPLPNTVLTNGSTTLVTLNATDEAGNNAVCSFNITVDAALNTSELNERATLRIFPNPASHQINISSDTFVTKDVLIYDFKGRLVKTFKSINKRHYTIDVAPLESSSYFIIIHTNNGKKIIRALIKE